MAQEDRGQRHANIGLEYRLTRCWWCAGAATAADASAEVRMTLNVKRLRTMVVSLNTIDQLQRLCYAQTPTGEMLLFISRRSVFMGPPPKAML